MQRKCVVGISGGVDSASCLKIFQKLGFKVYAIHLKMLNTVNAQKACNDAQKVANDMQIPFIIQDVVDIFSQYVLDEFCNSYLKGNTPNPCVLCNAHVKFKILNDVRKQLDCDFLSTGHYAIIKNSINDSVRDYVDKFLHQNLNEYNSHNDILDFNPEICNLDNQGFNSYNEIAKTENSLIRNDHAICNNGNQQSCLQRAIDKKRDQSYFLYNISRDIFPHIIFPLGGCTKQNVRDFALKNSIHIASKSDSQDICFLGENKSYVEFINKYVSIDNIYNSQSCEIDRNNASKDNNLSLYNENSNKLLMAEKLKNISGNIVDENGEVLSTHDSLLKFTIGQRKGLNLSNGPYYVKKIINNDVIVSKMKYAQNCVIVSELNFFCDEKIFQEMCADSGNKFFVKMRSNENIKNAQIHFVNSNILHVFINENSIAIDQHCVVYNEKDQVILGGKIIETLYN